MAVSIVIIQVTHSVVANWHPLDAKTFKGIISGLYFTIFVNILLKLRYFEGRNCIQIG